MKIMEELHHILKQGNPGEKGVLLGVRNGRMETIRGTQIIIGDLEAQSAPVAKHD